MSENITKIDDYALWGSSELKHIYYEGNKNDWASVEIRNNNLYLDKTLLYYSDSKPSKSGNYWHYVEGVPTPW